MTKNNKKRESNSFINYFIFPTLSIVVGGFFLGIISKYNTGQFFQYFFKIPIYIWIVIGIILLFWILVQNRKRKIKLALSYVKNNYGIYSDAIETVTISQYEYKKLNWDVKGEINKYRSEIVSIEAGTPPHCPKCDNMIEEHANLLFYGYRWVCPWCGYFKISKDSYRKLKHRLDRFLVNEYNKTIGKQIWPGEKNRTN